MTRYSDSGHPLDDASILRSSVHFTTAQRAYSAELILAQPLDELDVRTRSYLTVNAFVSEATAYEDFLGWIVVLQKWSPGDFGYSLARLLDVTTVDDKKENQIEALAATLNSDSLRDLLHVPPDDELARSGFLPVHRERITKAMAANVESVRRVVAFRKRDGRAFVKAFNKIKHQFLAVPVEGYSSVLIPKFRDYDRESKTVRLKTITLATDPETIRLQASRAIASQAVLNGILGVILWSRYGDQFVTPDWAARALTLPGWVDDDDSQP